MSAVPIQAIRTLKRLAILGKLTHPVASKVLQNDKFFDDILSGADTVQSALCIQTQLNDLLSTGYTVRLYDRVH